ncbi:hypothetical protein ASPTUDRAFT_47582 [Aspergillus tubingensis CBS 134.48]|uniref:Uncharacterized protein n=1 Tax=Aspergillus tubingensis (strain CBS 134.48) TaxID=767770 RepID=A0A1L9MU45_ASPTC|nr:hypothetical protein ASPTUDRAFT_47582 [Aspergillus tubingensis CBS 134.48]
MYIFVKFSHFIQSKYLPYSYIQPEGLREHFGHRAVGLSDRPDLDPSSKSQATALAVESMILE